MWAEKGSRPVRPLQNEYEWVYIYGAVNPNSGESCALILPWANTAMMQLHLDELSKKVGPDRHIVLVMDNASWHTTGSLKTPDNITSLPLPAYTPELNVIERLWHWFKSHEFSNRIYDSYDSLVEELAKMWQALPDERIKSVCACSWTRMI